MLIDTVKEFGLTPEEMAEGMHTKIRQHGAKIARHILKNIPEPFNAEFYNEGKIVPLEDLPDEVVVDAAHKIIDTVFAEVLRRSNRVH